MGNEHSDAYQAVQNGILPGKHEDGSVNASSTGNQEEVKSGALVQQNGHLPSTPPPEDPPESTVPDPDPSSTDPDPPGPESVPDPPNADLDLPSADLDLPSADQDPPGPDLDPPSTDLDPPALKDPVQTQKKSSGRVSLFGKMFKKKPEPAAAEKETEREEEKEEEKEEGKSSLDQMDGSPPPSDPQTEQGGPEDQPDPVTEAGTETPEDGDGPPQDTTEEKDSTEEEGHTTEEEGNPEPASVMNFFKTLVNSTKTSKKETATPAAAKEQPEVRPAAATATTVAQISEPPGVKGMSVPPPPPPPPPPEPHRAETKGEPAAAKPAKTKEEAKEGKESKGKSARGAFSKFFHPKTNSDAPTQVEGAEPLQVEEEVQEEAELPQTLIQEVEPLVDHLLQEAQVDQKVAFSPSVPAEVKSEAAEPVQEEKKKTGSKTSFFSFLQPRAAAAKEAPVAPPPQTTPPIRAQEAPAAPAEAAVGVGGAPGAPQPGGPSASPKGPKTLEKRNSITGFFKNLAQKRPSTDAGVQTQTQ